ncbi:TetR/AcrR family transcriptional regulator [Robertmurraya korlensis]|uniref:TetR/AcrR family transcriptional regulator n=1 Tax=Robertmurraya korlensis TaxID=519977 RepID=UPI0008247364|nr:TetR/AcrR family transcriptional regulator [Robertmurraya korlensis]
MDKKLDSKEKILQIASGLFQLQGYHATGINQIIKETGLPKGSIYHHFPNGKEELALAAVKFTSKYIEDRIIFFINKELDVVDAMQAFIIDSANQFRNPEDIEGIPLGLLACETALISEPLRLACMQAFQNWEQIIVNQFIKEGYEKDVAAKAGILFNSLTGGGIIQSLTNKDPGPLLAVAEAIPLVFPKKG